MQVSTNEREFVLEALRSGIRVDGRKPLGLRTVDIDIGADYGHVNVRLGKTQAMVQVMAEIVAPYPDRPTEGQVIIHSELSPMATRNESIKSAETELTINRMLERIIRKSRAIETEGLCIVAGHKVWRIVINIHFLDNDGNLLDAACIGVMAALLHFRRPDVTVIGQEVTVHTIEERNPVALSINHVPICVSFAFLDDGQHPVLDPTLLEEQLCEGDMMIAVNAHREICAIQKAGGLGMETSQLMLCTTVALEKGQEITEMIQKALAEAKTKML
ncbi:hypothetical protein BZG36_04859 [Bifiguratus adelaidae]|uniref:Exosome complex component RRP45 n=1 Tax=Bifiguratus adelaidae TaxID=1938954 RepID=A0A261XVQ1_9FUNG|nr:hypothetical protein BZG36_04859 [Bifiguratus adelaidae]